MNSADLLKTDAYIAQLLGVVDRHAGYAVVRTPDNPGFYFGNFLILDEPPRDLSDWLRVFEESFGERVAHRCIAWSGLPLEGELAQRAKDEGLVGDSVIEMSMGPAGLRVALGREQQGTEQRGGGWVVRKLRLGADWQASLDLSRESDGATRDSSELISHSNGSTADGEEETPAAGAGYRLFRERQEAARHEWLKRGLATWWGAFDGEILIGQCGLVACGDLGRFQDVMTHPEWRRKGVCSALIHAVARDAFEELHLPRLILAAEVDGPAIGLYGRLGFEETGRMHSLMRHPVPMRVREESISDHAGVRSLVTAAFQSPGEALLIERLRKSPGAISLVAEQANTLLGHILFSRLRIDGSGRDRVAITLAPLAVRPSGQKQGVGSRLVREGLEVCKRAGIELCVVIGSPEYYDRFGFVPAAPFGLKNPFDVKGEPFMVLELVPGALSDCAGALVYDPAFSALDSA